MTSLAYEKIYSRLFAKIEAYDFIEIPEEHLNDMLCTWLHSTSANPYVRKLFSTLTFDDILQSLSFKMKYSIDDESDIEFVVEILSIGMAVAWLEPKVNSLTNIGQFFGSKEERWFSQASHIAELRGLVSDFKKQQRRMIADRGYAWNSYLDGE